MKLTSPSFKHGEKIPKKYTCQGEEVNPPLDIHDVPNSAKSLALLMDDPDVPPSVRKDRMWVHWLVTNIDPKTKRICENCKDIGIQGLNTGGTRKYMGPCPPDREHRYFIKIYALDTQLDNVSTKEELLKAMEGHILDQAELMGRYEKD